MYTSFDLDTRSVNAHALSLPPIHFIYDIYIVMGSDTKDMTRYVMIKFHRKPQAARALAHNERYQTPRE